MKRRDLLKLITEAGYEFDRHGANHDIYKKGKHKVAIKRHVEFSNNQVRMILRECGIKK